jgi:hypothetical protein
MTIDHSLASTADLLPSERRFLTAMQQLSFGRFEFVSIHNHELVLNPFPMTMRQLKFGTEDVLPARTPSDQFELQQQVVELFTYVRAVDAGEIRCLEVRHGLPFSMEVEYRPDADRGYRG